MSPKKKAAKKKARKTKAPKKQKKTGKTARRNVAKKARKRVKRSGRTKPSTSKTAAGSVPRRRIRRDQEIESGDLQGLSRREGADSESVDELLEEGNAFEAGVVEGVEEADDSEGREVHTREVPEDDVPEEYLDEE
jgi:hypothetical protein